MGIGDWGLGIGDWGLGISAMVARTHLIYGCAHLTVWALGPSSRLCSMVPTSYVRLASASVPQAKDMCALPPSTVMRRPTRLSTALKSGAKSDSIYTVI